MRILLLGDFSSFHKYLKDGLVELGHEVVLASIGDGWKAIPGSDMPLYKQSKDGNRGTNYLSGIISAYKTAEGFCGFDVVQVIYSQIYHWTYNEHLLKKIFRNNKCVSVVAAGSDLALAKAYREGKLKQYAIDYEPSLIAKYEDNSFRAKMLCRGESAIIERADVIIPASYEYQVGYENSIKRAKTLPMPVNVREIEYKENVLNGPVVIFHGISRANVKGTPFVMKALDQIKIKYEDQVEIIMTERLPFKEYLEVMDKTNILIDQCCGYGYGINTDIALAKGKVVLSGARPEALEAYGVVDCPVFGILPDENQIVETLSYIIDNKRNISKWGYESRQYVERLHDCKKVAEQYVEIWKATGKI